MKKTVLLAILISTTAQASECPDFMKLRALFESGTAAEASDYPMIYDVGNEGGYRCVAITGCAVPEYDVSEVAVGRADVRDPATPRHGPVLPGNPGGDREVLPDIYFGKVPVSRAEIQKIWTSYSDFETSRDEKGDLVSRFGQMGGDRNFEFVEVTYRKTSSYLVFRRHAVSVSRYDQLTYGYCYGS